MIYILYVLIKLQKQTTPGMLSPFSDGNGRMGRFWQSLILSQWNPLLAYIPVESVVFKHQKEYYNAIQESTDKTDSAPFIEFILTMLLDAINSVTPQATPQIKNLILVISEKDLTRDEAQQLLTLKDRKSFKEFYIKPALDQKLIEMTIPEKPNSPNQKYRLTSLGKQLLIELKS
ncbi:hypothetical protein L3V83_09625 [Thiotrichales bacterium 19X7-9]|nr:hypothetical protein [Thiotrichales bacterium 19X7-9]